MPLDYSPKAINTTGRGNKMFKQLLSGGDPRSLKGVDDAVSRVVKDRNYLTRLFNLIFDEDETIRMRVSDALEKICVLHPEWFKPFIERLLTEVPRIKQPSVQWHLAQMLSEIELNQDQTRRAIKILKNNLKKMDDWIVTNLTLDALAAFTRRGALKPTSFVKILKSQLNSRHKSVVSRTNRLLNEFTTA